MAAASFAAVSFAGSAVPLPKLQRASVRLLHRGKSIVVVVSAWQARGEADGTTARCEVVGTMAAACRRSRGHAPGVLGALHSSRAPVLLPQRPGCSPPQVEVVELWRMAGWLGVHRRPARTPGHELSEPLPPPLSAACVLRAPSRLCLEWAICGRCCARAQPGRTLTSTASEKNLETIGCLVYGSGKSSKRQAHIMKMGAHELRSYFDPSLARLPFPPMFPCCSLSWQLPTMMAPLPIHSKLQAVTSCSQTAWTYARCVDGTYT